MRRAFFTNTRGTTQIVSLLRNTPSGSSKPYSLTQNHGSAYCNFGTLAQKGYIELLVTGSHHPPALCKTLAIRCVSSSQLMFRIIAHYFSFVKPFLKIFSVIFRSRMRKRTVHDVNNIANMHFLFALASLSVLP